MENKTKHIEKVKSFFNNYSNSWEKNYDADGIMSERTVRFSKALTEKLPEGALVLDFGCGSGDLTVSLKEAGFNIQGYDLSELMIKRAQERYGSRGIVFTSADKSHPQTLPYDNKTFDAVTASSVFEYIDEPVVYFKEIFRALKPGGYFVLTVPDNRHLERRIENVKIKFYNQDIIIKLIKYLPDNIKKRLNVDFFRISKTRLKVEKWVEMLKTCGFTVDSIPKCETPLVLLTVEKI
ncbi:class I SAM-dependent methyltransferase [Candidatus Magnetomonas plexicatena]|uniref:class I SAM-dependent methyltransferase n=1 Tax=Candidatus Magnetomonas plexicatena TaxID=2552947 RepID=UPI001C78A1ED|nr:class I SAM-dependent methyltransferase [Nitrospirales bacterium LBB_01]